VPIHIIHSHYFTVDIPMAFWFVLTLYFSSKIMKSGDVKYYILAGISLGLGVSTKYNSGLVLVPVLTAHYLSNNRRLTLDSKIIKMGLAGFVFFVLSSPYTILAYDEFKQGLIYISYLVNFENTGFEDSGLSYIFYLKRPLLYGIGPFLLILTVIGIAHSLYKFRYSDILVFSATIPYYLVIGNFPFYYSRYLLPIIPILLIIASNVLMDLKQKIKVTRALSAIIIIVSLFTLLLTVSFLQLFVMNDPRDHAAEWISNNVPPGKTIGIPYKTAFFTPPINESRHVVLVTINIDDLDKVDYYVTSDFDFNKFIRSKKMIDKYREESFFYEFLFHRENFVEIKKFENSFGLVQKASLPLDLPHDMAYPDPTIIVLKRIGQ
ncbi:MAG: ArnT family glycosyltransferase, partial [Promethearchaeota archaeon]